MRPASLKPWRRARSGTNAPSSAAWLGWEHCGSARSAALPPSAAGWWRRGINPQEYLTDLLRRLPAMKNTEIKDLVPSRWKPSAVNGQVRPP